MYQQAKISTRFIALVIDHILIALVGGFTGLVIGTEVGGFSSLVIEFAYQAYFLIENDGQTPGKQYMNIRVIKTDGSRITATDAGLRVLGYYINTFALFLGWIWVFFDRYSQGWHDKLAKTYVVKAPERKQKQKNQ